MGESGISEERGVRSAFCKVLTTFQPHDLKPYNLKPHTLTTLQPYNLITS